MSKIFVKPVDERDVPKPDGTTLKPEGEMVTKAMWWKRRERDGDVTISDSAPNSDSASKPAKKKEA